MTVVSQWHPQATRDLVAMFLSQILHKLDCLEYKKAHISFILKAFLGDVTPNENKLLVNCILREDLFSSGCHKAKTKFILCAWLNESQNVSLT